MGIVKFSKTLFDDIVYINFSIRASYEFLVMAILGTVELCRCLTAEVYLRYYRQQFAIILLFIALQGFARLIYNARVVGQLLKDLPGPKGGILGAPMSYNKIHLQLLEFANKYGPIFTFRSFFNHVVVVTDPALATHCLHSPHLDKWRIVYSIMDPFLNGESILTGATDLHWKVVRKSVAPSFSTVHMREALDIVVDRANVLIDYFKNKGPQSAENVDTLLLMEAMDVIGEFGFNRKFNALDELHKTGDSKESKDFHPVRIILESTHELIARVAKPLRFLKIWEKNVNHGRKVINEFVELMKNLLQYIKSSNVRKGSFADLVLKANDPATGAPLKDTQITPEIAALFFAGIDTTGHTNTWLLFMLSQYPEVEKKICEELDSLELLATPSRPNPRSISYADLSKLEYTQATIKEVLRMYPPVGIGQIRQVSRDIVLANKLRLPKGCIVWMPHTAIQNAKFNWDEPAVFKPERWLTPGTEYVNTKNLPLPSEWYSDLNLSADSNDDDDDHLGRSAVRRPKRYFPFAEGPRNCVGQNLAKVSLVVTTVTLMSHFSFKLADKMGGAEGVNKREVCQVVTGVKGGMWMHAIPRVQKI